MIRKAIALRHEERISIEDVLMENLRGEGLVEDFIKELRSLLPQYGEEVRRFVRDSLTRGFDRDAVLSSLIVFMSEIKSLFTMAEDCLSVVASPKGKGLRNDLEALKMTTAVFVKTLEKTVLERPVFERQTIYDDDGRFDNE